MWRFILWILHQLIFMYIHWHNPFLIIGQPFEALNNIHALMISNTAFVFLLGRGELWKYTSNTAIQGDIELGFSMSKIVDTWTSQHHSMGMNNTCIHKQLLLLALAKSGPKYNMNGIEIIHLIAFFIVFHLGYMSTSCIQANDLLPSVIPLWSCYVIWWWQHWQCCHHYREITMEIMFINKWITWKLCDEAITLAKPLVRATLVDPS